MLSGKRIILGVTGGIAAYKAAFLLRAFQQAGAEVKVTMTPAATRFVGVETFASLSGHEVAVEIFPENNESSEWTRHINWGEWADLFVIAPCTANTLSKIAHGNADNMLTSTVLAARCPILLCPTMDGEMYHSPGVSENIKKVKKNGYYVLEPESGYLASGLEGKGRLPGTENILEEASNIIGDIEGPLKGKKVIITAGPTREFIDAVRFISNPSSGKMGVAMACAAKELGANVTLIHGPLSIPEPEGIHTISITSTADLFEAVKKYAAADVIIMAAAASDFTPVHHHEQKIKKSEAEDSVKLKQTQDILAWLGNHKKPKQVLIGFAMETDNLLKNANKKLKAKNADWIIANSLNEPHGGFASDENKVYLLGKDTERPFNGPKNEIALQLLNYIFRS